MTSFDAYFQFRKSKKVTGAEVRLIWDWGTTGIPFEDKTYVTWGVVMMEHPVVCNVRSDANDPFLSLARTSLLKNIQKSATDMLKLLPKVGIMSPSVCSCPRELF